jgi:oxygen-dependent protoporphyrinogen oxidase
MVTTMSTYSRANVGAPLDGFGFLVPTLERRSILGAIFTSTIFPSRATPGSATITSFVGGARQPEIAGRSADEIGAIVHKELSDLLKISSPPESFHLHKWERSIPQFTLGYDAVLNALTSFERNADGMHLLGNYRGKASVPFCIESGRELARHLVAQLGS